MDTPTERHPFEPRYPYGLFCRHCGKYRGDTHIPMPEWRRRSLEGRGRFDAVSDMTDRVAGR